jgi:hypothetical protein
MPCSGPTVCSVVDFVHRTFDPLYAQNPDYQGYADFKSHVSLQSGRRLPIIWAASAHTTVRTVRYRRFNDFV